METVFTKLLKKWPNQAHFIRSQPQVLILSKNGLDSNAICELQNDFIHACGDRILSIVISLKMMHAYFRLGAKTYDYRPHRGPFSKLAISDYHCGNTDRMEVLLRFSETELRRFSEYTHHILQSPLSTLGKPHALSLTEPDFTVRSHQTHAQLNDNRLKNLTDKHNCLTWFTTAPLGEKAESVIELLSMSDSDIRDESHSYIVALYRFLTRTAQSERVPGVVFWTNDPLNVALKYIHSRPDFVTGYYSKP